MITAVCTCGDEWTLEGGENKPLSSRLDARVAVLFAADRKAAVGEYNTHLSTEKKKHPKGRP